MNKQPYHLDENLLTCIEQFWGFNLPEQYKRFILKYEGEMPVKTSFNFKREKGGSTLDSFYEFSKGPDNILIAAKDMGNRYPSTMLPIADDVFGNRILLTIKGPDRGKVYFWDHEREAAEGETPDYSNLTLIADSFDEFLNSLHELEDI